MDPNNIPIIPINDATPIYPNIKMPSKTAIAFTYTIDKLVLFESLRIFVSLHDDKDFVVDTRVLTMDGVDYTNWGNDDKYVINWIKKKLTE
jgi:hypothetical protein